jgi:hypothetical protein
MRRFVAPLFMTICAVGILSSQDGTTNTPSTIELQLRAAEKALTAAHPDRRELEYSFAAETRLRQSARCVLPDGTAHLVNAVVEDRGRRFQCVETYDQRFNFTGVSWTPAGRK